MSSSDTSIGCSFSFESVVVVIFSVVGAPIPAKPAAATVSLPSPSALRARSADGGGLNPPPGQIG